MFELNKITRESVKDLRPYTSARDEYSGAEGIFLDANENPFGDLNRYPDPYQRELKSKISKVKGADMNNIFIGNGSDEIIDLMFRVFCEPKTDSALTFAPTYGMYDVSAAINEVELIKVQLNDSFEIDIDSMIGYLTDLNLKLILICSPNNPTGNTVDLKTIEQILKSFQGIVLVDEAYIDFSDSVSCIELIDRYPNLIVTQTMSKAWGLAAARIGMAFCSSEIVQLLNKVKPPYNVSELNQKAAINALDNLDEFKNKLNTIKEQKEKLQVELNRLSIVKRIYPSQTNFLLVEFENASKTYNKLIEEKIIVRNRNSVVKNCIRITVGSTLENNQLINVLKTIK